MKLPNSLREQLKIPLGVLLPENQADKENIQKHISENSYVITVGDRTTEKMIDFGFDSFIYKLLIVRKKEQKENLQN